MRQQFIYQACPLGWQARQPIFAVGVRVVHIEPSTLNQAHQSGAALAHPKRTGEQPVVAADGTLQREADVNLPPSVRKPLNMSLPPPPEIGDLAPRNPDRVANAASILRLVLELGVHDLALLGATDG